MNNDTVVSLAAPARVSDPLTELLRTGARRLIEAAVSAEFEEYLSGFVQEQLPDGRQRVVRNGHLPERKILTGVGEVDVRVPRLAIRPADGSVSASASTNRTSGSPNRQSGPGMGCHPWASRCSAVILICPSQSAHATASQTSTAATSSSSSTTCSSSALNQP